jgi:hypothetical protein
MQNRYAGDVGDYGKYALLRRLCGLQGSRSVRLGVVWCLFPDESSSNDGRHISYLRKPEFAQLDPDLHTSLAAIVSTGRRSVASVTTGGFLPAATVFCSQPIMIAEGIGVGPEERLRYRAAWLQLCLHATKGCELVFFDPDNGIEAASVPKHHPKAGKYIYWDELASFWRRGSMIVIYHHLNRTAPAARQVSELTLRFEIEFPRASVTPLVFRRGSSRVFWLVHDGGNLGRELENRAADFLSGDWSRHFRPFGWPDHDQAGTLSP